jgi:hypothetical protein
MPEQEQAQSQPQTKTQKAIDKQILKIAKLQAQRLKQKIREDEEQIQINIPHSNCSSCQKVGTGFEWAELLLCVGSLFLLYAMYKMMKEGQ